MQSRCLAAVCAVGLSLLGAGCEFGGPVPDEIAATRAQNDAIWRTRQPILINGNPFELAVAEDKDFAQVAPAGPAFSYSAAQLEGAIAAKTGCAAVFQGGFLDRLNGYTPDSNLRPTQEQMEEFSRWRVDLTC